MSFEQWWEITGSSMAPLENEDCEAHAKRVAKAAYKASKETEKMFDKNGREIHVGDTLYNPHDEKGSYPVLQDKNGKLYLGDFDSPLGYYAPHLWWEVVS
jgi:hypothetical protein